MTITAEVKGCTIALRQPPLASGTVGAATVAFHFDADWDGTVRTAVFRTHGKNVLVLLENDRCALPPEAAAGGDVLLGAFGVCGEKTLTTPFCRLAVAKGVPTAGDAADGVTPSLGAQLLAAYGRLTAATAEAAAGNAAAVRVTEDGGGLHFAFTLPKGDKGDTGAKGDAFTYGDFTEAQLEALKGAKGDKGDRGAKGEPGYTPVKGVDYWTEDDEAAMTAAKNNASIAAGNANSTAEVAEARALEAQDAAGKANAAAANLQAKADAGDFNGAPGAKGDKGDTGDKGEPGADGYTPVRGTDYWTDADKAAINADIAAQVAGKADKIDGKGLSTNDYTDADKAAVVLLGKNVTLLKEITTTEEASVIVLLDNVKIRNFFIEAEIAKAAANTAGQLILSYTDGSSVYCTMANSFNSARANKSSYIGYDIHGMQPILCRNQSTSGISGTYAALSSFHYGNNAASKIRYHSVDSTVVPVGSKFTVYGILED